MSLFRSSRHRIRNRRLAEIAVLAALWAAMWGGFVLAFGMATATKPWVIAVMILWAGVTYVNTAAIGAMRLSSARKTAEKDPARPAAWYRLSRHLYEHGKTAEAVAAFRNAIQLDPRIDIRKADATVRRMITFRATRRADEHRFIRLMVPLACLSFLVDEADRARGSGHRTRAASVRYTSASSALRTLANLRVELSRREADVHEEEDGAVIAWRPGPPVYERKVKELRQLRRLIDEVELLIREQDE
jgi:hypothetical protein